MGIKCTRSSYKTINEKYQEMAENIEANFRRGLFTQGERDAAMDDLTTRYLAEHGEV